MGNDYWQGKLVRLRGIESPDWEMFYEMDRDYETTRSLYWVPFPRGKEATKQWTEKQAIEQPDGDNYFFVIEDLEGQPVGAISTHGCNRRMGTLKYGIGISNKYRGKGYASEAIKLVIRYYFKELGYQKVVAMVYSFNEASQRLHESLGFRLEGRLRRMVRAGGVFHDELLYGITDNEFRERAETDNQLEGDGN